MDLELLERLAREATPGPWYAQNDEVSADPTFERPSFAHILSSRFNSIDIEGSTLPVAGNACDADFIAAANPTVILRLVEIARAAQHSLRLHDGRAHIEKTATSAASRAYELYEHKAETDRAWDALRAALEGADREAPNAGVAQEGKT